MTQLRRRGFTLVEVLVAMALLAVVQVIVMSAFSYRFKLSGRLDRRDVLTEVMQSNVLELEARPISSVPADDKCRVRRYDESGGFLDESEFVKSSSECSTVIPGSAGMRIVISASAPDASSVSFKNPDGSANGFLKLPTVVNTLRAVRIQGGSRTSLSSETLELSITMYKQ